MAHAAFCKQCRGGKALIVGSLAQAQAERDKHVRTYRHDVTVLEQPEAPTAKPKAVGPCEFCAPMSCKDHEKHLERMREQFALQIMDLQAQLRGVERAIADNKRAHSPLPDRTYRDPLGRYAHERSKTTGDLACEMAARVYRAMGKRVEIVHAADKHSECKLYEVLNP